MKLEVNNFPGLFSVDAVLVFFYNNFPPSLTKTSVPPSFSKFQPGGPRPPGPTGNAGYAYYRLSGSRKPEIAVILKSK